MKKKLCSKCKIEKNLIEFHVDYNTKSGYRSQCKLCIKNKYILQKDEILLKKRENYNPKLKKDYYEINKENVKQKNKDWSEKNKKYLSEYKKKYYQNNIETRKEYTKLYYEKNKNKIINRHNKKYKNDYVYKFKHNLRTLILGSFKRNSNQFKKDSKTETILGCTIEEFRVYIQSLFLKGMALENHGEWHLDHIIPLASATSEEEIIKLNHYTNFQPLWAKDNLSKGCRNLQQ
jgi:hypothetical protein